jgi:hypothetical protein
MEAAKSAVGQTTYTDSQRKWAYHHRQKKIESGLPPLDPQGYIAYLPHSGFNNQRYVSL